MSLVLSRHRGTKTALFRKLKQAVDSAVPYPRIAQYGFVWRQHPITEEHYVDWTEFRDLAYKAGKARRRNEVTTDGLSITDLGPLASEVEEFLAGRLR